jgi:hypothetical protein
MIKVFIEEVGTVTLVAPQTILIPGVQVVLHGQAKVLRIAAPLFVSRPNSVAL